MTTKKTITATMMMTKRTTRTNPSPAQAPIGGRLHRQAASADSPYMDKGKKQTGLFTKQKHGMKDRISITAILIAEKILKRVLAVGGIDIEEAAALISSWAREADDKWLHVSSAFDTHDEFLTYFAEEKLKRFAEERKKAMKPSKTAYLVTFEVTARVVSDKDLTTDDDDSEVVRAAAELILKEPWEYLYPSQADVVDICLDDKHPYDPQLDDKP